MLLLLRRRRRWTDQVVPGAAAAEVRPGTRHWLAPLAPARALVGHVLGLGSLVRRRTVTVDVDGDFVRVVVLRGRRVLNWGTAELGGDAQTQENGNGPGGGRVPDQLSKLLRDLGGRRGRMLATVPLHGVITRRFRLPKMARRYANEVVSNELLEAIPFAKDEVDIRWQAWREPGGDEALAVAVPKESIEGHLYSLRSGGCRPAAAYARAATLALAGGFSNAIVVDVTPYAGAIVLARRSWPEVVYRVTFSREESGPEEVAGKLAEAVTQVAHYGEALGAIGEGAALPVVLVGPLAAEGPWADALARKLAQPVLPFVPALVCPEHFPASEYAANLGLVEAARMRGNHHARRRRAAPLNLLPRHYLPSPVSLPLAAAVILFAFLAIMAYPALGKTNATVARQAQMSARLGALERQERTLRLEVAAVEATAKRQAATGQTVQGLEGRLAASQRDTDVLVSRLDVVTGKAPPPGVQLGAVSPQSNGFVLSGLASTWDEVVQYARNLQASGVFVEVRILRLDVAGGGATQEASQEGAAGVSFQIKAVTTLAPKVAATPAAPKGKTSP